MDLSCLDQPKVLEVIFPLVYSPFFAGDLFSQLSDNPGHFIQVADGVKVGCEFWAVERNAPTILFFHGNGETAASYDFVAPFYNERGINLFVADYRGYGASTGMPTVSSMLADAQIIFEGFIRILEEQGFRKSIFVMGRSLGSMSAIEVAANHGSQISGLIIESGSASNFLRLCQRLGLSDTGKLFDETSAFLNKYKIRKVLKPTLIIHGEYDELVPLEEGRELYQNSGARDKRLLVMPGVGHNDITAMDPELYFGSIRDFIMTSAV